jgi:hypothetical protein
MFATTLFQPRRTKRVLFKWGQFIGAGGSELDYKIECDALEDSDWNCIAAASIARVGAFSDIAYVPTGGRALAKAFGPYRVTGVRRWLVVDDVWTTGTSMNRLVDEMKLADWIGFVAFARGSLPTNVKCFAKIEVACAACSQPIKNAPRVTLPDRRVVCVKCHQLIKDGGCRASLTCGCGACLD